MATAIHTIFIYVYSKCKTLSHADIQAYRAVVGSKNVSVYGCPSQSGVQTF